MLHVDTSNSPTSHQPFSFSLKASKHERTQVYLSSVNSSGMPSEADTASSNGTMVVKVTLPMLNATGSPVLMCASFVTTPPSALNLEACGDEDENSGDKAKSVGTSQREYLYRFSPLHLAEYSHLSLQCSPILPAQVLSSPCIRLTVTLPLQALLEALPPTQPEKLHHQWRSMGRVMIRRGCSCTLSLS